MTLLDTFGSDGVLSCHKFSDEVLQRIYVVEDWAVSSQEFIGLVDDGGVSEVIEVLNNVVLPVLPGEVDGPIRVAVECVDARPDCVPCTHVHVCIS